MSPVERRGRIIFLAIASLIVGLKLSSVILAFAGGWEQVQWWKSVIQPLGFALGVVCLWQGENWLRWLLALALVVIGGSHLFVVARLTSLVAKETPPQHAGFFLELLGLPLGLVGAIGLFYLSAGLVLLMSPSVKAFFAYQREIRARPWIRSD